MTIVEFFMTFEAPGGAPLWHVKVAESLTLPDGAPLRVVRELDMAAAVKAGLALPKVLEKLGARLAAENREMREVVARQSEELRDFEGRARHAEAEVARKAAEAGEWRALAELAMAEAPQAAKVES